MIPVLLQTAKAFMQGTCPSSRYHLLCAGQEAVERCCGRSLLHPAQVLLGHAGQPGAALGRRHAPLRRVITHARGEAEITCTDCLKSTGKKEVGRLNWQGPQRPIAHLLHHKEETSCRFFYRLKRPGLGSEKPRTPVRIGRRLSKPGPRDRSPDVSWSNGVSSRRRDCGYRRTA